MILLVFCAFLGLIPGAIAASKGRNFFLWWLYGACLFILALPHSIFARSDKAAIEQRRHDNAPNMKCPSCAELIKADAKVCRYCHREVYPALPTVTA